MPSYIDSSGKIVHVPGPKKPPMTRAHYEQKVDELWKLDGMITLDSILVSHRFLTRERKQYIDARFDGMPE